MNYSRESPRTGRPVRGQSGAGTAHIKSTTPPGFWRGWRGPQDAAPQIHRKPAKVPDTLWRPDRGRA